MTYCTLPHSCLIIGQLSRLWNTWSIKVPWSTFITPTIGYGTTLIESWFAYHMFRATSTPRISSRNLWAGSSSSISMKCLVLALRGSCDASGGHVEFSFVVLVASPILSLFGLLLFPPQSPSWSPHRSLHLPQHCCHLPQHCYGLSLHVPLVYIVGNLMGEQPHGLSPSYRPLGMFIYCSQFIPSYCPLVSHQYLGKFTLNSPDVPMESWQY